MNKNKNATDINKNNKNTNAGQQKCQAERKQHRSINNYDANAVASTTMVPTPWHQQCQCCGINGQSETINLRKKLSCSKKKYNKKNEPCWEGNKNNNSPMQLAEQKQM